jgi:hypothetical protein
LLGFASLSTSLHGRAGRGSAAALSATLHRHEQPIHREAADRITHSDAGIHRKAVARLV